MNEEIITTLLYSITIIIFITTFFQEVSRNAEINSAYYRHVKALQEINAIINHGNSFEQYCSYLMNSNINGKIISKNETCQTYSSNPFAKEAHSLTVSLPVLNANKIIWVSSYA